MTQVRLYGEGKGMAESFLNPHSMPGPCSDYQWETAWLTNQNVLDECGATTQCAVAWRLGPKAGEQKVFVVADVDVEGQIPEDKKGVYKMTLPNGCEGMNVWGRSFRFDDELGPVEVEDPTSEGEMDQGPKCANVPILAGMSPYIYRDGPLHGAQLVHVPNFERYAASNGIGVSAPYCAVDGATYVSVAGGDDGINGVPWAVLRVDREGSGLHVVH